MSDRTIVAEIGSCNGDMAYAEAVINHCAQVGIPIVKGQLFQPSKLVTMTARGYGAKFLHEPDTQWEAFDNRFRYPVWDTIQKMCESLGIQFAGSVFDTDALQYTDGWAFIKIASADITHHALLDAVGKVARARGQRVVLSTGASTRDEIAAALTTLAHRDIVLLACTLSYPCPEDEAHVARMGSLRQFGYPVGYSDHTIGRAAANAAFQDGAVMVEKHVTITPGAGGDHNFGATPKQLASIIETPEPVPTIVWGSPELAPHPIEEAARYGARRSWHAVEPIAVGDAFTPDNVAFTRPADGLTTRNIYGLLSPHVLEPDDPVRDATAAVMNLTVE